LPPVIFGIGPIIGAILCLLLPETMNCELPETIEDGENFGKYEYCINNSIIILHISVVRLHIYNKYYKFQEKASGRYVIMCKICTKMHNNFPKM
jgi:hypothetical protein